MDDRIQKTTRRYQTISKGIGRNATNRQLRLRSQTLQQHDIKSVEN